MTSKHVEQPLPIRNLADLKRAIRTHGVTIRCLKHWQDRIVNHTRTPKVTRNSGRPGIQANGYYYDAPDSTGKIVEMWAPIPNAKQIKCDGSNQVVFFPSDPKSWTLEFFAPQEALTGATISFTEPELCTLHAAFEVLVEGGGEYLMLRLPEVVRTHRALFRKFEAALKEVHNG